MALALATVAQLRNRLQDQTLDADVAQQALDDAGAIVRAVAKQDFDLVVGDTVTLAGGTSRLTLPQRPVVVDGGHPLTVLELPDLGAAGVTVTEGTHFRRVGNQLIKAWRSRVRPAVHSHGHLEYAPIPPGIWAPWVQVTYSHGYATTADVPAELTAIVLDAATVYATNPGGLRSVALDGEVTLTWATESLNAPRSLVDDLARRLSKLGVRRGGAFSIQAG